MLCLQCMCVFRAAVVFVLSLQGGQGNFWMYLRCCLTLPLNLHQGLVHQEQWTCDLTSVWLKWTTYILLPRAMPVCAHSLFYNLADLRVQVWSPPALPGAEAIVGAGTKIAEGELGTQLAVVFIDTTGCRLCWHIWMSSLLTQQAVVFVDTSGCRLCWHKWLSSLLTQVAVVFVDTTGCRLCWHSWLSSSLYLVHYLAMAAP